MEMPGKKRKKIPARTGKSSTKKRSDRAEKSSKAKALLSHFWVKWTALGLGLALLLFSIWLLMPFWRLSRQFASFTAAVPTHVYAQPVEITVGERVGSVGALAERLNSWGLRQVATRPRTGSFQVVDNRIDVVTEPILDELGWQEPAGVRVEVGGGRVVALQSNGRAVESVRLASPLLAVLTGSDGAERIPIQVEDLPDHVVRAVLAAEDSRFFSHSGISPKGIARAAVSNARGDGPLQGGSTLTQQLVKNLYLTHERTWVRKAREAVLALLIDAGYGKEQILEAYLNEIYWGRSGDVNVAGIGAAAEAYFNKPAAELTLAEAALLAGMISAPAHYLPSVHPDRSVDRRNWVLRRMAELEWIGDQAADDAAHEPLEARTSGLRGRRAPFFLDRVLVEVEDRYELENLSQSGFQILTSLQLPDQWAAEKSVADGINRNDKQPPEVALISIDAEDGAILAYVGGNDYGASQFDRVRQSRRQAGSAFKPVVFATAFALGSITPASLLVDEPLTVQFASRTWSPENSNGEYSGWVSARQAVERSLNVPTARLGMQVGLEQIVQTARKMGIEAPLKPYPSLSLGAFEVSPQELVTVYATLAAEGVRPTAHAVTSIRDRFGVLVEGEPLAPRERVLSPQVAYLMTSLLRGAMDRGTGRFARSWGLGDDLAGKTGTSNERRDSWFAGYSPEVATAVWVGYDDNQATQLGGARAALPIWTEYAKATRPVNGYPSFRRPVGIESVWIDPLTGLLATPSCPHAQAEDFLASDIPNVVCPLHRGVFSRAMAARIDPRRLPEQVEIIGHVEGEVRDAPPPRKRRGFWRRLLRRSKRKGVD